MDKKLLSIYKLGWQDACDNNPQKSFNNKLFQRAYTIGWLDFIVGDDLRGVDYQTEKEILESIKSA